MLLAKVAALDANERFGQRIKITTKLGAATKRHAHKRATRATISSRQKLALYESTLKMLTKTNAHESWPLPQQQPPPSWQKAKGEQLEWHQLCTTRNETKHNETMVMRGYEEKDYDEARLERRGK